MGLKIRGTPKREFLNARLLITSRNNSVLSMANLIKLLSFKSISQYIIMVFNIFAVIQLSFLKLHLIKLIINAHSFDFGVIKIFFRIHRFNN